MKKIRWYIGCSGFAYKEWKEIFYPSKLAQKDWFPFYAQRFNSLELNVSFYRFPTLKGMQGWYDKRRTILFFRQKFTVQLHILKKLDGVKTELENFMVC